MGTPKKNNEDIKDTVAVIRAKMGLKADGELDGNGLIGQVKEHAKKIDNLEKHVSKIDNSLEKLSDKIEMMNKNINDIKQSLAGNITEKDIAKYYKFVIGLFAFLSAVSGFMSYLLYIKK